MRRFRNGRESGQLSVDPVLRLVPGLWVAWDRPELYPCAGLGEYLRPRVITPVSYSSARKMVP